MLAVDYGRRRLGVAVSDKMGFVHARPAVIRSRDESDMEKLGSIAAEAGASALVVGLPVHMSGEPSGMSQEARGFGEALSAKIRLPVNFYDERMTTREAEKLLLESDRSRKKRKKAVDSLSAVLLLESYLAVRKEVQDGGAGR